MAPQNPFSLLLLLVSLFYASTLPLFLSLSTVAISETSNQTLICALARQTYLNCTSFPLGTHQNPIPSPNVSLSAITAGDGFVCFLRYPSLTSVTAVGCYRFSGNGSDLTYKRIYRGAMLNDFDAGNSHICGLVGGSDHLVCWQWPGFNSPNVQNLSEISVGKEFVCGLLETGQIKCFGTNNNVVDKAPEGNYSLIVAGLQQACAISMDGTMVNCWGQMTRTLTGNFNSLALGDNRGCALQANDTVFCWGENNFVLPENLRGVYFLSITGKSRVFCGIIISNYSLICWGDENLGSGSVVFQTVMPGPCQTHCQCGILADYGKFCNQGYICQTCKRFRQHMLYPPASARALQPPRPESSSSSTKRIAYFIVGSVGSASLLIVFCFFLYRIYKRKISRVHDSGPLDRAETTPEQGSAQIPPEKPTRGSTQNSRLQQRVSHLVSMGSSKLEVFILEELRQATDNFSNSHKIGSGSYGSVYRAKLQDGRDVAIKRAELTVSTSPLYAGIVKRQEDDQDHAFLSELAHLSRLNHKHLVQLYGYCDEANERVLVYEFMVNGTLHDHLHKLQDSPLLSWAARIKVALDAARGIEYLHSYAVPQIIHRDIKSSNILLDTQWTAKVSDFGFSLMGPDDDEGHISLRAAGTMGYMDPAYYKFQQLTTKSDVYSFGVVLIELLSGRKAIHRNEETGQPRNVVDYMVPYIVRDEIHRVLDPRLPPPTPFEIEAVAYVGYIAADCVVPDGRDRPTMTEIVSSLERALTACLANPFLSRSSTGSSIREVL
ncbi:hypothetical protein NE237_031059 [Protea cynaroides]|uniref:non-specific serine/threonine protein kinase n=1 Tax=Protea cynaroides TaxID=273540 RepID=A0A9Q0JWM3_9MAGN|nr:hypothetical protein NE237_031059 [Protea cynaroides]